MPNNIPERLRRAWNVFMNRDPTLATDFRGNGPGYSTKPDRVRLRRGNEKSIVSAVYTRLAIDVAQMTIQHVQTDEEGGILEVLDSGLNRCFNEEANIDQTGRAFIQDLVLSMFDEGCVAAIPVDIDTREGGDPDNPDAYDICSMRTAKILEWRPNSVRVQAYNDRTGIHEEVEVPKAATAIIENPLYPVMNEPNSTMNRLIRKLNLLDVIDEQNGAGKLDIIIQLPYAVRGDLRKKQASERRSEMADQLANSKYGVAYMDATEKITQLNRPVENNLLSQIEYLTELMFNQLGLTPEVFDGTADDKVMSNYYLRSVEPIVAAISDEFHRKYLSRTARSQHQAIYYFRNPFKFIPVLQLAEITDKLSRNEIVTPNEIRRSIGMKTAKDERADELRNRNIAAPAEELQNGGETRE